MFNARRQGYPGISYTTLKAETERDICFERRSKQVKNERMITKDTSYFITKYIGNIIVSYYVFIYRNRHGAHNFPNKPLAPLRMMTRVSSMFLENSANSYCQIILLAIKLGWLDCRIVGHPLQYVDES